MTVVGIVANEFFDAGLGRMGGFGANALLAARALAGASELDVQPVFVSGEHRAPRSRPWRPAPQLLLRSSGFPLLVRGGRGRWTRRLQELGIDLLLTIDHRVHYDAVLEALPETPLAVWIRDPRPPDDLEKIATLRIPGDETPPQGIVAQSSRSLGPIVERSRLTGRPVAFVSPAPALLAPKAGAAYGVDQLAATFLGNALEPVERQPARSARPSVVFLGRLDPIKRPWLVVELARRFPDVEFRLLGRAHHRGPGSGEEWLRRAPANVSLLSHVDGEQKLELVGSAWALVNTSIHEGLATSFLEALHCGVPLLSCQDPEHVATRFGVYVGRFDGSGADALPALADGLTRLLGDDELRERLGGEGREWARTFHTRTRFLTDFAVLLRELVG